MDPLIIILVIAAYLCAGFFLLMFISGRKDSEALAVDLFVFGPLEGIFLLALWPIYLGFWLIFRPHFSPAPAKDPEHIQHKVHSLRANLIGKRGLSKTDLRPYGKVVIADSSYEARTEGGFIARGNAVEVIGVDEFGIEVRPIGPSPAPPAPNTGK